MYMCACVCVRVCVRVCVGVQYMGVCVWVYMGVCVWVYMGVCVGVIFVGVQTLMESSGHYSK